MLLQAIKARRHPWFTEPEADTVPLPSVARFGDDEAGSATHVDEFKRLNHIIRRVGGEDEQEDSPR